MRILICDNMFPAMIEMVTRQLPDDDVRVCNQKDLADHIGWAEVIVPAMARISQELIAAAPDLKLIQQFGVGLEGVDLAAAKERGVPVANVPGDQAPIHAESTAEGGVFLMMACARLFKATQQAIANGEWGRPRGDALMNRTALIIGLGAVGQALAKRLVPMGMTVWATEAADRSETARRLGLEKLARPEEMMDLLPEVDFLISAVTLTEQTKGLLNRAVFERMKPSAYLINISRGPIVNEADLAASLEKGLIAGAGLDVLAVEPPPPDHPLINNPRVVITPHTAGVTEQSFGALGQGVAANVERLKQGLELNNRAV